MSKRFTFIGWLLALVPMMGLAQEGDLYLYNYQIPIPNLDPQNLAAVQGPNGLIYFANKKGVLSYDGVSWEIISTQNTPYALASAGRVYVGCRNDFGYLERDKTGREKYISIAGRQGEFGEITRILNSRDFVYFYSDLAIFKVAKRQNRVVQAWRADKKTVFLGVAQIGENIYVNLRGKGMHLLKWPGYIPLAETKMYAGLKIRTAVPFDQKRVLLGMSNNWTYLFDGNKMQLYLPQAKEYLKGNVIQAGVALGNDMLVMATLSGGAVVIDKKTYATRYILNYQTGLPDDEVFAMCTDNQGGLWLCHAKGISRADQGLPLRTFSGYAGLEGNIEGLSFVKDSLFVATSDGLFYLYKVDRYEEIEGLIRKEQRYLRTVEVVTKTVKITEPRLGTRIRRYQIPKDGYKSEDRRIEQIEETETKRVPVNTFSTETISSLFSTNEARRAYAIQSIPFIYKKVPGLDAKCRQLLYHQQQLLAATNLGLYRIIQHKTEVYAEPILRDAYVNFILPSTQDPSVLYVATSQGITQLKYEKGQWTLLDDLNGDLNTSITSVLEFQNDLWLGAESRVFKVRLGPKLAMGKPQKHVFQNSYSEEVVVRLVKGQPAFILTSGIYSYSAQNGQFFKNPRLERYFSQKSRVIYKQPGYTWIKNRAWLNLSQPEASDTLRTLFLDFFENVREIYVDAKRCLWLVDGNTLYRINADAQLKELGNFNVFIRYVFNKPEQLLPLDQIVFAYSRKPLSFTFRMASPFYRGEHEILYQYWLEGLSEEWTDWDTQAVISFPYIPSGEYKLHVRARNIFGQQSQEQIYSFKIRPPFWETYWFYGLQIGILLGLLFLSFLFSRSGRSTTISFVLTLISLITLFEFLFLLVEPYVDDFANGIPVLKLGLNILLALSLAPIERLLRHWLEKPASRTPVEDMTNLPARPQLSESEMSPVNNHDSEEEKEA